MSELIRSRIFAVKTTGGQERNVANLVSTRVQVRKKPVASILVLDSLRGYILIEAANANLVGESTAGLRHVKSQIPGIIQFSDVEKFLVTKSVIAELGIGDTVEIVAGPFKGMKAKINRIERARSEVTVILLDAPYQLPVTVDAEFLRITEKASSGASG